MNRILEQLRLSKAEDKTFIGKIERGFDFLGFYFTREGMSVSKKSVRKFAENIGLKLSAHGNSEGSKITPAGRVYNSEISGVYNAKQLRDKNNKGDLPIPETVSVYIQHWLIWVKSIYGTEETQVGNTLPGLV